MRIAISNDHAATSFKIEIVKYVESLGHEVINLGTDDDKSVDYPVYAYKACKEVVEKRADFAIIMCGTGLGVSIASNKVKGIRAALCSEEFSAEKAREHNDANVLCMGARVIGIELAKNIVRTFLNTAFAGDRHKRRVDLITKLENDGALEI